MNQNNHPSSEDFDLAHIFDISPDLICILDREHKVIRANQAMIEAIGASSGSFVGSRCYLCVHQTNEPVTSCVHEQLLKDGKSHTAEMFIDHLGGWFSVNVTPLHNDKGVVIGSLHVARDIAERKKTEEKLRTSEARYKNAQEAGHIGSWEYDINKNIYWASDEAKRIYGIKSDNDHFLAEDVLNCMVDKPAYIQAMVDLLEKNRTSTINNITYEIIPVDSTEKKTINSIAELIKNENGQPIKVTGVLLDITERRKAEVILNKKTEELKTMNRYFVNRELKMVELKNEINELLKKSGNQEKYIV
ncbi:MAG: PAS domain-containing protein [Bacteroidetes bacterium]|nr:PAS domain-containing protein [Bacteroidota bacterium]